MCSFDLDVQFSHSTSAPHIETLSCCHARVHVPSLLSIVRFGFLHRVLFDRTPRFRSDPISLAPLPSSRNLGNCHQGVRDVRGTCWPRVATSVRQVGIPEALGISGPVVGEDFQNSLADGGSTFFIPEVWKEVRANASFVGIRLKIRPRSICDQRIEVRPFAASVQIPYLLARRQMKERLPTVIFTMRIDRSHEIVESLVVFTKREVRELRRTCYATPSQWEGKVGDSGCIYIRYRAGHFSVRVSPDSPDLLHDGVDLFKEKIGPMDEDPKGGYMTTDTMRKLVTGIIRVKGDCEECERPIGCRA